MVTDTITVGVYSRWYRYDQSASRAMARVIHGGGYRVCMYRYDQSASRAMARVRVRLRVDLSLKGATIEPFRIEGQHAT